MAIKLFDDEDYDLIEKRPSPPGFILFSLLWVGSLFFGWFFLNWRVNLGVLIGGYILKIINFKVARNYHLANIAIIGVYVFTFIYYDFFS